MDAFKFNVKGNWAQFRKAETNNNPLSHDFMTKTALIGMIGAVLGIERADMKENFPILSSGLKYTLRINNNVKKQSWGFTLRNVSHAWEKAPKQMEFIKNPDYTIVLGCENSECKSMFDKFREYCMNGKACFTPVLGLHNCPAELEFVEAGMLELKTGNFETYGFVTNNYEINMSKLTEFRIGFDKIPTFQNNDFWNLPEYYKQVVYPSNGEKLSVSGDFYDFNGVSQWCMI